MPMIRSVRRTVLEIGIVGGLLFTIHASIPYSRSWPMIWPALAGALAVWRVTREPRPHPWRSAVITALATGVVTAAIAFIGVMTVVYITLHTGIGANIAEGDASAGAAIASLTLARILAISASLAAIDLIVAFLGGVVVIPARYFQAHHAHA